MGFLSGLGNLFHHSTNNGRLPPGNSQWAQLANFYPTDSKAGLGVEGWGGLDPSGEKRSGTDVGSIVAALGALGGSNQPPPAPPPMQFAPMPQPTAVASLQNAPRIGQQQMMQTPQWMQPYMWGGR